jgi:hypothetical protein
MKLARQFGLGRLIEKWKADDEIEKHIIQGAVVRAGVREALAGRRRQAAVARADQHAALGRAAARVLDLPLRLRIARAVRVGDARRLQGRGCRCTPP